MSTIKHIPMFLKSAKSVFNNSHVQHYDKNQTQNSMAKNICGKFLAFLMWIFGFFPVTNPFLPIPSLRFRLLHPITFLSIAYIIYPVVLVTDIVYNNPPTKTLNTTLLSRHILYYSTVLDSYISNSVIRVTCVIYCTDFVILLQLLRGIQRKIQSRSRAGSLNADTDININSNSDLSPKKGKKKRNIRKILYIVLCTVGSVFIISFELYATLIQVLKEESRKLLESTRLRIVTLPDDTSIRQLFVLSMSFILRLVLPVSISFVAIVSVHLVEIYEQLASILQEEVERIFKDSDFNFEHRISKSLLNTHSNSNSNGSLTNVDKFNRIKIQNVGISHPRANANNEENYEFNFNFLVDFPLLFQDLKKAFSIFSSIAGNFTLAILVYAGLNIFQTVSRFTFNDGDYDLENTLISLAWEASLVFFMAHIGEMMTTKISTSKEAVEDYVGKLSWHLSGAAERKKLKQVDRWVRWFSEFSFNLSARNFFRIQHALIPAVCAALLTYFIFIFQLRQSENFTSGKFLDSK